MGFLCEPHECVYDGARHELFNETNRDEVLHELETWLDEHFS